MTHVMRRVMSFEREALLFAADLKRDGVLPDPSDEEIILAVEEYMGATRPFSDRLRRGIVEVFDRSTASDNGFTLHALVRSAQSKYGLC